MTKPLPPLTSIRAFESAARLLNFSRASEEIGVTPGAISKQILLLEDFIGVKLFERLPGSLTLTPAGYALKTSVQPAFELLSQAFSRYARRPPRSNVCRVATLASFAGQFLVPRLDQFNKDLPNFELEILTSTRLVDFAREEIDIGVRYGLGEWSDVVANELVKGELVPVCAPELLAQYSNEPDEKIIQKARRIQLFSSDEWRNWSELTGIELNGPDNTFIIEDTSVAMEATLTGQGLSLLPDILVRRNIKSGKLIRFSDQSLPWKQTYFVTHAPNAEKRPVVRDVIAWLRKEVANE